MEATQARSSGTLKWLLGPALAAVVAATLLIGGVVKNGGTAHAATGDQLRQIVAATPACSVGTGLAFDGTNLILDCWSSNQLWLVNPANGALVNTLTITGASDLRAIAWDGGLGELWACNGTTQVVLIDLEAQTATPAFTSQGCIDGLAFDGTDNTLWASWDATDHIEHFQTDGTLINSFSLTGKLGGYGNSGIAVGGDKLYLANNGGSQIYQCPKDLSSCTLMSTFPARIEDLECDNITFSPKGAIWSIDAYDRTLNAWEIPAGTCNFGGGVGAQPTATPRPAQPTPCIGGIVNSRCPKNPPVVNVTPTLEPTQTEAPSATAEPPTAVPPQPTATLPGGGAAGVITGPNTGSGPDGAGVSLGWLLAAAAVLAGGAGLSVAGRRLRQR
jgi:hypothetical protein